MHFIGCEGRQLCGKGWVTVASADGVACLVAGDSFVMNEKEKSVQVPVLSSSTIYSLSLDLIAFSILHVHFSPEVLLI